MAGYVLIVSATEEIPDGQLGDWFALFQLFSFRSSLATVTAFIAADARAGKTFYSYVSDISHFSSLLICFINPFPRNF